MPRKPKPPIIYSSAQLGELLDMRPTTFANYAKLGKLPGAIKLGLEWVYTQETLDYLRAHRRVGTGRPRKPSGQSVTQPGVATHPITYGGDP